MTEDVKMNLYNDLLYIKVNNGSKLSATLNKSITFKKQLFKALLKSTSVRHQ